MDLGIFKLLILINSKGEIKLTSSNKNATLIQTPRLLNKSSISNAIRNLESIGFLFLKVNHSNKANVKMLMGDRTKIKMSKFIKYYTLRILNILERKL
jgi:hypothetical protein